MNEVDRLNVLERSERERIAIAIYEARVHTAIINGWDSEPAALRERFLKAADAALQASGAVKALEVAQATMRRSMASDDTLDLPFNEDMADALKLIEAAIGGQ